MVSILYGSYQKISNLISWAWIVWMRGAFISIIHVSRITIGWMICGNNLWLSSISIQVVDSNFSIVDNMGKIAFITDNLFIFKESSILGLSIRSVLFKTEPNQNNQKQNYWFLKTEPNLITILNRTEPTELFRFGFGFGLKNRIFFNFKKPILLCQKKKNLYYK